MIIFKRLSYKNFLSAGDTPIEIDLDSHRTTLIVGKNGNGKCLRWNTKVTIQTTSYGSSTYFGSKLNECRIINLHSIKEFYRKYPDEIGNISVLTRFGFYKIEAAAITAYDSEIIKVGLQCGNIIEGSPDHLLLSHDNKWIKIRDLKTGDFIQTKTGISKIILHSLLDFKEDLYDLQVEEVKEFYANDIVSHNSSILDALSFVLFNKPHRDINRPQLVNSINNKNCIVTLDFEIGTSKYKIIRGIKPGIFEIWQDGKQLNQEANSRDYQKILETNILKLNHRSFHQIVVLGSSNFVPFMKLAAFQRRVVIEDLLDISIFTKMNILLKDRNSKHKEQIKDTDNIITLINEKIKMSSKHLSDLKQIDARNSSKILADIDSLKIKIDEIQEKNVTLNERYSNEYPTVQSQIAGYRTTLKSLGDYESGIKYKIDAIVKDAKFYENNEHCPTCSQTITSETKDSKLHDCKIKATTLNEGYSELKTKIDDVTKKLDDCCKKVEILNRILTQVSANQKLIRDYESRIESQLSDLQSNADSQELERIKISLNNLREEKNSISELRLKQIEERTYNEVIFELLKDTGIKTKIIRQYLPVMNKLINSYLQVLDFFVSFHLDEGFKESIKSRHRDDFSYASFSEGERMRINLALLFAWRHVAKMKNSANTNLLILDEIFDGSMDSDGVENLLQILSTLDAGTNVFIISHKQDVIEGKFERKIEIEKVKNFSQIAK